LKAAHDEKDAHRTLSTERRERVALVVTGGKSNRAIAAELSVDEATVRRDRRFLSTPLEQRPVKEKKPKKVKPVRELSPDEMHDRRLKELLKLAQEWVV
jgi:FixJ family two-component response regulator